MSDFKYGDTVYLKQSASHLTLVYSDNNARPANYFIDDNGHEHCTSNKYISTSQLRCLKYTIPFTILKVLSNKIVVTTNINRKTVYSAFWVDVSDFEYHQKLNNEDLCI